MPRNKLGPLKMGLRQIGIALSATIITSSPYKAALKSSNDKKSTKPISKKKRGPHHITNKKQVDHHQLGTMLCTVCNSKVILANKGKFDIEQHLDNKKHKHFVRSEIVVDENKCFDQFHNLRAFWKNNIFSSDFLCVSKWVKYFDEKQNEEFCSELKKICSFFFAIPGHNTNTERVFSLLESQWTDKRNHLKLSTVESLAMINCNYKNVSCSDFYRKVKKSDEILKKVSNSDKYHE
ncbi:hypothetical protein HELRODRAFT_164186 [Helobdella robusta]|uniref:HAT C-terminal dimerisation domain-containing protein n=1 Tax=Helobdella robusta TaxID=6412 RepID=T1EV25_HELRO|nr:hypothetical protein HELRODRAFT_164186 [Helobdella robusta]ESN94357.1 hypothetical protein HELRODRAFT_164186 [Helobdella robusta]